MNKKQSSKPKQQKSRAELRAQPKPSLAEMIVAVIEHPDCPEEIRDAMSVATSDLFNRLNEGERQLYFTAPYIHALIVESKEQEGSVN